MADKIITKFKEGSKHALWTVQINKLLDYVYDRREYVVPTRTARLKLVAGIPKPPEPFPMTIGLHPLQSFVSDEDAYMVRTI